MFSPIPRRTLIVWSIALSYALLSGFAVLHDTGIVGTTRKNGFGCICHSITPSGGVSVWIEGPTLVQKGTRARFTLAMSGGPAVAGGFNAASSKGSLSPFDGSAQLLSSSDGLELTHTSPKAFVNDTVRWDFYYDAPNGEHPLQFPGKVDMPDYLDFAYFAFVVGMTAQTADVCISGRRIRRTALLHGIVAYAFNTAVVALSIGVLTTLL